MIDLKSRHGQRLRWYRQTGVFAILLAATGVLTLGLAGAETVETNATVSREAYFTYPITQTAPPLIRNGFPPATACLVAGLAGVPQICGTEAQQVASLLGLTDGLPIPITPDGDLAQPTALPGTTPVGMFGGQPRYVSLAAFNLPALQSGQRYGKFELVYSANGLNFAVESPATRNLVLQIVSQLGEQDPALVAAAVTRALSGEIPLAAETITGIEACPIVEEWNGGRAQGASLDGSRAPDVNCLTGTTGVFDEAANTWTFDISFAVQAWTEGTDGEVLPNQGIMLRPLGAPNFAYGDPDFSVNWVVSLADSTNEDPKLRPRIRYTTVEDATEAVLDPGGAVDFSDTTDDSGVDLGGDFGGDLGSGPFDDGTGGVVTDSGGSNSGSGGAGGTTGSPRTVSTSRGSLPGWVWFVLPFALIAAYVFDQSLIATPAALRRRPGALTRLEARAVAAGSPEGD